MSEYLVTETVDLPQGFSLEISNTEEEWHFRLCRCRKNGPWEKFPNPANIIFGKTTYLYYMEGSSYTKHLPEGKVLYWNEVKD